MRTATDFWKFAANMGCSASLDDAFIAWAKYNNLTIKEGNTIWKHIVASVNSALSIKLADDIEVEVRGNPEDVQKVLKPEGASLAETGLPPAEEVAPASSPAGETAPIMEESLAPSNTPTNMEPEEQTEPLLSLKGNAAGGTTSAL